MLVQPGFIRCTPGSKSFPDGTFDQKSICSFVSPPDKLPLYKRTAEGEKGNSQDQASARQQKSFLEKSTFSRLSRSVRPVMAIETAFPKKWEYLRLT